MTYCVKGLQANDIDQLNQLWQEAEEKGELDQIINATDDLGDLPIHKAANFGNYHVLQWIFNNERLNAQAQINTCDS